MSYIVKITDTAKQDLRDIAYYIAESSKNKSIATKFVKDLHTHCMKLEAFPYVGSLPKDRILVSAGYRFLIHDDYLIFYSVDEAFSVIYVLAIFNAKRDYIRVMRRFI